MTKERSRVRSVLRAFRSLRSRNYRLYWFGQLISLTGTWAQDAVLGWFVLTELAVDSPWAVGLMVAIRFTPVGVLSLYGGVLADRLPKRRTLMLTQSIQLAVALSLAVLTSTDHITLVLVYVLVAVRGLVDAVDGPTRHAFVPELVGNKNLSNAISLNSTLFNGARIAGPALAGVLLVTLGYAACFYLNAASFAGVIVGLLAMRRDELHLVPRVPRQKTWSQVREGLRYARRTPEPMVIFIIMAAVGTFGFIFQVTIPLVNKYLLDAGELTLSILFLVMGLGAVVAGLVGAYLKELSRRLMLTAVTVFTILLASVGLSTSPILTAVLLFAVGFAGTVWMIAANTRLQLAVPGHLRGRIMSIYLLLFMGTTPIGSLAYGQLAENVGGGGAAGTRGMLLIAAGICAVGVAAGAIYAWRHRGSLAAGTPTEEAGAEEEGQRAPRPEVELDIGQAYAQGRLVAGETLPVITDDRGGSDG